MADPTQDSERWRRIDALFAAVLERPEGEREAFLEAECDDPELRRQVRLLLRAEAESRTHLDRSILTPRALMDALEEDLDSADPTRPGADGGADRTGERVGPYELERLLGEGGMARVYLARRVEGGFEQKVAVKLIRGGLSSAEVVRRFRAERDILSGLRHPNIARLLDGGATADGQPYLVMEPVDGIPVTRYTARHDLDVEATLWVFLEICQAIAYAHRNLVVHRDIKPSNILVTDEGRVMLLDFGIAKLLDDDSDGDLTLTRAAWMTPGYGAPEQIQGGSVTTGTDVYQLGVLLYELLSGRQPFDVEGRSTYEIARAICEQDPQRPSAVEGARGKRLGGDLDAIVMKAMRKEPEERYASVEAMASDVRRYLTAEPIEARKGSRAYRARKFVRRNRGAVAAAAGFALLLSAYAVTATVQGRRIARERDRARNETDKATQVTAFLTSLMEADDPREAQGDTVTVREVLERGVQRIGGELGDQPDVQAELYLTTGSVYLTMGDLVAADSLLGRALEIRRGLYGEGPDEELAEVEVQLGRLRIEQARFDEAETLMRSALDQRRALNPAGSEAIADDMVELASVLRQRGHHDRAEALFKDALAMYEALDAPPRASIAITRNNLALSYHERGRLAEAMPLYEQAVEELLDTLGPKHPYTLILEHNLAGLNRTLGRYATADSLFEAETAVEREVRPGSPDLAAGIANLGMTQRLRGEYQAAEASLREALDILRPLGRTHPSVTLRMTNLAQVYIDEGRFETADSILRDLRRRRVEAAGPDGEITPMVQTGVMYRDQGRYGEAERILREALARRRQQFDAPHPAIAEAEEELGLTRWAAGDLTAADSILRQALAMRRALTDDPFAAAELMTWMADLERERGELDEADHLLNGVDSLTAEVPPGTVYRAKLDFGRARVMLARGQAQEALDLLEAIRPWYERQYTRQHPGRAEMLGVEGEALAALGRLQDAEPLLMASDSVLSHGTPRERRLSAERMERYRAALSAPQGGSTPRS